MATVPPTANPSPTSPVPPAAPNPLPAVPTLSPANTPTPSWVPLAQWCQASGLTALTRITGGPAPLFELRTAHGVLQLRPGSQLIHWDGLELHLGFAPQFIEGRPYVYSLDLAKTIEPLIEDAPPLTTNPIIVIDPGHGGENSGTRCVLDGRYEKEFTLDWADRLGALLTARGFQVYLTRTNDSDLALSNRVAFAAQHHADVFLSLHFNSTAPSETESGLETYCLTPAGLPSNLIRGFADETNLTFPNNAFDAQNLELALRVHRALLAVNGHRDRGVRRARFPGVLRNQERPAILVEGGYLSNPDEARQIEEPSYRQKLAEAVADAISEGIGPRDVATGSGTRFRTASPTEPPVTNEPAMSVGPGQATTNSEVQSHTAESP